MLIQKQTSHAKSKRNKPWKIGNKELKECTSYKYLGVTLKSNGSFSEHIDKITEKDLTGVPHTLKSLIHIQTPIKVVRVKMSS